MAFQSMSHSLSAHSVLQNLISDLEEGRNRKQQNRKRRLYVDGIWDLFHPGHVAQLKDLKELDGEDNCVVVGIVSDDDARGYKREPVMNEEQRKTMIETCCFTDEVIEHCPLIVTKEFMDKHNIDIVTHGFMDEADYERQKTFFKIPMELNKFRRCDYHHGISTTEIMERIKQKY